MPKQQSKTQKIWEWLWPYLCMLVGFGGASALIYLNLAYKYGYITVDYGGRISTAIAICILLALFIWYIKKVVHVFQLNKKLKNRH